MKICGIVAEFNPFHYGHAHLLRESKQSPEDLLIVVMSGSFVQRGEVAICDKWTRAQWALEGGADLVVELPTIYSLQSANYFAQGAIQLLNQLGCTRICFGSEQNHLEDFLLLAEQCNHLNIDSLTHSNMSYPEAFYQRYIDTYGYTPQSAILKQPNATLGLSYIRAVHTINPKIDIQIISRQGAGYHDRDTDALNPSASAIRQAIFSSKFSENTPSLAPPYVRFQKDSLAYMERLYPFIVYRLRLLDRSALQELFSINEEIAARLKAVKHINDYATLVSELKTKRYTQLFIQRMLACLLLNIAKPVVMQANHLKTIPAHILGFRSSVTKHLQQLRQSNCPLWIRKKEFQLLSPEMQSIAHIDLRATDIQALAFQSPEKQTAQQDFTHMLRCYSS